MTIRLRSQTPPPRSLDPLLLPHNLHHPIKHHSPPKHGRHPLGRLLLKPDDWINTFGNNPSNMLIPSTPCITAPDAKLALVARWMMI